MTGKIIAATALALCLGTAAYAGSGSASSGTTGTGSTGMHTWSGNIGKTFYSDANGTTLRSRDEIKQNWGSLSSQEQAQVRSDCQEIAQQAANNNGRTPGTEDTSRKQVGTETTASNSAGSSAATGTDTGTTASVNGGSMTEACDIVKGM